jgi:hypothetical protein
MDEVITFVQKVFQELHQLEILNATSFNENEVQELADALNEQYFYGTIHGTGIAPQYLRTPEQFTELGLSPANRKAPILFQLKLRSCE